MSEVLPPWSSPIEAVHAARDALYFAVAEQVRMDRSTPDELSGYGSALVSVIQCLGQLSETLRNQIGQYDRKALEVAALDSRNNPVEQHQRTLEALDALCEVLTTAAVDANRYWDTATGLYDDLR